MYEQPYNHDFTDDELVKKLNGFSNNYADVNGISLHYVSGGSGAPLILLPGWPETWWAWHKVMPALAEHFHVIAVDIRGMGRSGRPAEGYDKKNMAEDIYELTRQLNFAKINIAGHDIGAHVAFSFAANYPEATAKLAMIDTPHPDKTMYSLPMLPVPGQVFPWWLAFNQVKDIPEQLLAGKMNILQDHVFRSVAGDDLAIDAFDRKVYAAAYQSSESVRAGNAWYQAFNQDIADLETYKTLQMPVAGIGGSGFNLLKQCLPPLTSNLQLFEIKDSGHFLAEEKPEETASILISFFL